MCCMWGYIACLFCAYCIHGLFFLGIKEFRYALI
jgi:hypothetical protein